MKAFNYFSQNRILKHSFSTPLSTILVNTELAMQSTKNTNLKKNHHFHLNQVLISARYLSSIIKLSDETLDITQQSFSPLSALQEIIAIAFKPDEKLQVISHLNINPNLKLTGNKFHFQEAMICILNNASEAYGNDQVNHSVLIVAHSNKKYLKINVSDGGKGISWLKKQKIHLYSFSSKKNRRGIGLEFAKQVIKNHFKGMLNIESKNKRGTTVKIVVPLPG